MNRLRSWSRRAWLLHGYLLATLILPQLPLANASWTTLTDENGGTQSAWAQPQNGTIQTLSELDAMSLDGDGDGAYNYEELTYGSDPTDYDSDDDGLNDGDEIHLETGVRVQNSDKLRDVSSRE